MVKIAGLIIAMALSLSLTGCSNNNLQSTQDDNITMINDVAPKCINCGYQMTEVDNKFYCTNNPTCVSYKDLLELEPNIKVNVIEELKIDNKKVSSSYIIEDIKNGYVDSLDKTLGTLYYVKGRVIRGLGNGKKLSFPTLNFEFYDEYVIPKKGVYGVNVEIDGKTYLGMANIGVHPSICELDKDLLEVHLFNFNEDVYGKEVKCTFLYFIRDEVKFNSLDDLINQLKKDKEYIIKKSGDINV
jgi:riboflavin kinase/FMN adenylyltransferase